MFTRTHFHAHPFVHILKPLLATRFHVQTQHLQHANTPTTRPHPTPRRWRRRRGGCGWCSEPTARGGGRTCAGPPPPGARCLRTDTTARPSCGLNPSLTLHAVSGGKKVFLSALKQAWALVSIIDPRQREHGSIPKINGGRDLKGKSLL